MIRHDRPRFTRVIGAVLHPYDAAAGSAHRLRQPIDRRDDLTGHRNLALRARRHEIVLHVNHDERRFSCVQGPERVGHAPIGN
jgi:hypothetical protein